MEQSERLHMPLFSIRIVKELTDLTPRQIRYYESHGFVKPARTEGNQRLFSFADVDRLLDIKQLIDRGVNMAGIKEMMMEQEQKYKKEQEEREELKRLREQMKREALHHPNQKKASMIQGQLSHFYKS
ncbi:MerR family transcriptional regulator [Geomicrobium sediminis]|uniref:MerR family glutamine synthetase transcriptional repressor n=1 Tax=Geomicrobium sediminis TaxID=1347788 RepID=A0ABS2PB91_9BACL|nr:MerR family transcriptional regulator [Geomicrobium sediminis]MBM7632677.1 MerR family glutamine synthetase transcriptional repressor [Geomicrobium sediminis]